MKLGDEDNYGDIFKDLCYSEGRYCGLDPDGDGPLKGIDSINEILRQICVYKLMKID